MENNKKSIWVQALNHGIVFGLIMVVLNLIVYFFDLVTMSLFAGLILWVFNLIIYFIIILILSKSYRNNVFNGYINYGKALSYGLVIGLYASVIYMIYNYIFLTLIDPDYLKNTMDTMAAMTEEYMINAGLSDEIIEKSMEGFSSRELPSPIVSSIWSIPSNMVLVLISTLFSSIFAKKKSDPFTSAMADVDESEEN